MKDNKKGSKVNKWIVFTSMPIQMGVTIYLFYRLGIWLDLKMESENSLWSKGLTMFGVIASLYQFIKQANRISKNE